MQTIRLKHLTNDPDRTVQSSHPLAMGKSFDRIRMAHTSAEISTECCLHNREMVHTIE